MAKAIIKCTVLPSVPVYATVNRQAKSYRDLVLAKEKKKDNQIAEKVKSIDLNVMDMRIKNRKCKEEKRSTSIFCKSISA